MTASDSASYRAGMTSLLLVGGSSVAVAILGAARVKVVALTVGPEGVGSLAVLSSTIAMATVIAGLGINQSGIRRIALSLASVDGEETRSVYVALSRISLVLGALGTLALVGAAPTVSRIAFGNSDQTFAIAVASTSVFANVVMGAHVALLQGLRKIWRLGQANVIGGLLGSGLAIPSVLIFGIRGLPFFVAATAIGGASASWLFARTTLLCHVHQSWRETWARSRELLRLGSAFMVSSLSASATAFLINTLLVSRLGLPAAGYYQASFSISGVYVGFVLAAMGKDFFPRLTGVIHEPGKACEIVNQQIVLGVLVALPGLLLTITCAPLIIEFLYSAAFQESVPLLRWQVLGVSLKVVSWPLGFALLAKGAGAWFVATEITSNLLHLGLVWFGVHVFGLSGAGIAFFALYVLYCCLMVPVAHRVTGYRLSRQASRLIAVSGLALATTFLGATSFGSGGLLASLALALVISAAFTKILLKLLGYDSVRAVAIALQRRIRALL